ncbi:MAG: hypothetical protein V1934_03240 [Methanobacteriota archaeon]
MALENIEIIALTLSIISLAISLFVAYRGWKINEIALRRSFRQEHYRMLLEVDKHLMQNPELWKTYDKYKDDEVNLDEKGSQRRRRAFIYLHLNLFEMIFDYYEYLSNKNKLDINYWNAWNRYIYQFFRESSEARAIFKEKVTQEIFSDSYNKYILIMIAQIENEMALTSNRPKQTVEVSQK